MHIHIWSPELSFQKCVGEEKVWVFWCLERNPDGSQFVLDVLRDVFCHFRHFDVSLRMAFKEAWEHCDLLSQSDLKRLGSMGGRVQDPKPVCLDQRGSNFHRTGSYLHVRGWHCCVLCVLEHWFVSASCLFDKFKNYCFLFWLYLTLSGFCSFAESLKLLELCCWFGRMD